MLVERRVEWVLKRVLSVFVRCVLAVWISAGRVSREEFCSVRDVLARDEMGGGEMGEAIRQRWLAMVVSWVDKAEAMGTMFEWKKSMSLDNISRSDVGIWPCSCAVTVSMTGWRSGGRSGAFEGRVESDVVRICVVIRFVRADVSVWTCVSLETEDLLCSTK
jgi:hypothetical protein